MDKIRTCLRGRVLNSMHCLKISSFLVLLESLLEGWQEVWNACHVQVQAPLGPDFAVFDTHALSWACAAGEAPDQQEEGIQFCGHDTLVQQSLFKCMCVRISGNASNTSRTRLCRCGVFSLGIVTSQLHK